MSGKKARRLLLSAVAFILIAAAAVCLYFCIGKNNKGNIAEESSGNELPEDPEITLYDGLPSDGRGETGSGGSEEGRWPVSPVPGEISIPERSGLSEDSGAD